MKTENIIALAAGAVAGYMLSNSKGQSIGNVTPKTTIKTQYKTYSDFVDDVRKYYPEAKEGMPYNNTAFTDFKVGKKIVASWFDFSYTGEIYIF